MHNSIKIMLGRMAEKVEKMQSIPSCSDPLDSLWWRIDELIIVALEAMKERGIERPLYPLSRELFYMACNDLVDNKGKGSQPVQTISYRALDTFLLVNEYIRMKNILAHVIDVSREVNAELSACFHPQYSWMIPPCFDSKVYGNSASMIISMFSDELIKRGILPKKK